ncbi:MAG TPA: T9SS type A sorting domain-containing protein [Bacteroidetes bacterium]|nr:T9SS type A sorting domain-containing protein [Bacteroidota bacterium]
MLTGLYPNISIYIPNDGNDYTFNKEEFDTSNENIYVWSMGSHTHQWGKDYDIWQRNIDGSKGDKIYDASNMDGDPSGVTIGFDYQHPPTRRWGYPFLDVPINEGFIHEAVFNNTGSNSVYWGPTSNDEMMIMGLMYLEDTTGLANYSETSLDIETDRISKNLNLYPNPNNGHFILDITKSNDLDFILTDISGKILYKAEIKGNNKTPISLESLNKGVYIYELKDNETSIKKGKLLIQ